MHLPLQQNPLQTLPQPPQFAESSLTFTHAPAQQDWPGGQGTLQALQFAESVCKFLHTPLQHVCPAAHIVSQLPQCVVSHTLLQQRPSQQVPLQFDCPAGQQRPTPTHDCPSGQQTPTPIPTQQVHGEGKQLSPQAIVPSGQHPTPQRFSSG